MGVFLTFVFFAFFPIELNRSTNQATEHSIHFIPLENSEPQKPTIVRRTGSANQPDPNGESTTPQTPLPIAKIEEIKKAVYAIERSRAALLGTWELGGISQMMLLFHTPTKKELEHFSTQITASVSSDPNDPLATQIRLETEDQLRAVFECPFPVKLITFNAPTSEGGPMTFDIAFLEREEDLVLDPRGTNPPSFRIAGGRASDVTEEDKQRYGHLFELA